MPSVRAAGLLERPPAWSLAVTAMLSVQLGAAVSVGLLDRLGVAGTAWLRMVVAAGVFLALARPRLWQWPLRDLRAPALLGVVTVGMVLVFQAAIARIPLGTVVAVEFLGPLTVAAVTAGTRRALGWPFLAFGGVLLLTQPWRDAVDPVGVALAAVAGACWGAYIVITQRVGDRFSGVDGLAVSMPVAALLSAPLGLPALWGRLDLRSLLLGLLCALLAPVLPWVCELYALRRLSTTAFGTLMALEPAIAVVIGVLLLSQLPDVLQGFGTALVVTAGIAAERTGRREHPPAHPPAPDGTDPAGAVPDPAAGGRR